MRVVVAGGRGYVGSVLRPMLRAAGHEIVEVDLGLYEGCDFGSSPEKPLETPIDIRSIAAHNLRGADAVVSLAALSSDSVGSLNPALTQSINLYGTLRLARVAKYAGVPRFVFFSSSDLYSASKSGAAGEDAPMRPLSPYGESKVRAEESLARLADDRFSPTYLRHATGYGASPRLRLDTMVNRLSALAVVTGRVRVMRDGSPWRSLVHVSDMSRVCLAALEAPRELVHNEAFNVGRDQDNLRVGDIAEVIRALVPNSSLSIGPGAELDGLDYQVDFSKLRETFPRLQFPGSIVDGIDELVSAYFRHGLCAEDLAGPRYLRRLHIEERLNRDPVDDMLRQITSDHTLLPTGGL